MVPPKPEQSDRSIQAVLRSLTPYQLTKPYMKNNYVYIVFLSLFVLTNVALFVSRLYEYRNAGGYVMMARACGRKFHPIYRVLPPS